MLSPIFAHIFLVKWITVSNMYRQSTMNSLSNNCAVFGVSFYLLMGPKFRDLLIGKKVLYHIFMELGQLSVLYMQLLINQHKFKETYSETLPYL